MLAYVTNNKENFELINKNKEMQEQINRGDYSNPAFSESFAQETRDYEKQHAISQAAYDELSKLSPDDQTLACLEIGRTTRTKPNTDPEIHALLAKASQKTFAQDFPLNSPENEDGIKNLTNLSATSIELTNPTIQAETIEAAKTSAKSSDSLGQKLKTPEEIAASIAAKRAAATPGADQPAPPKPPAP